MDVRELVERFRRKRPLVFGSLAQVLHALAYFFLEPPVLFS
jgi:hypothetical protein